MKAVAICVASVIWFLNVVFISSPDKVCEPVGEPDARIFMTFFEAAGNVGVEAKFAPAFGAEAIFETVSTSFFYSAIIEDYFNVIVLMQVIREKCIEHVVIKYALIPIKSFGHVSFVGR